MDAFMTNSHIWLFKSFSEQDTYEISNNIKITTDKINIIEHSSSSETCERVVSDILKFVEWGEKVVVPISSVTLHNAIHDKLIARNKEIKIQFYTGEQDRFVDDDGNKTTQKLLKDKHFKDVNKHWSNCDVLMFTNTLVAGVDFNVNGVFDRFIGVYCWMTSTPNYFV